jgi:aspartyl-tRNA(Asn)/glutamyl-tRNA(Gln) amidotransferase subunit A
MELSALTIHELHQLLKTGEVTSRQVTESAFQRIDQVEGRVHAFLRLRREAAMKDAERADARIRRGDMGPLTGIPIAIKDVICTKGIPTTCGSRILEPFMPPYNATVVEWMERDSPVLVGKTNMDEFAMGSSTEHSAYGPTFNPWDITRIPGGSSGGSAAAVAADECIAALGTDTGGSIRQPAALCGIVGMKPTYGRVSRFGMVAFACSLEQIGPFARDVTDCAIMLNAIAGHDPRDSTSVPRQRPDYTLSLVSDIRGMKVGVPREYFGEGLDPQVEKAVRDGIDVLKALGAQIVEVSLPMTEYGVSAYYIIAPSEASSNLARYDGVKYGYRDGRHNDLMEMYCKTRSRGFGPEVTRRIILGTFALSSGYYDAYYQKACQVRTLMVRDFQQVFQACDVLATPASPTAAFRAGEKVDDPLQMYLCDVYTIPMNLAGVPSISIPCGFTPEGLPIGLQIVGGHFEEEKVLRAAYAFEQATDHHKRKPNLA